MSFIRIPYTTREEWLEKRMYGIGGSDVSCIVSQNPYKTNLQLWQDKIKRFIPGKETEETPFVDNPFTIYGRAVEEPLREITKADFIGLLEITHSNEILAREDKSYLRGSLDGEIMVLQDFEFMAYFKPKQAKLYGEEEQPIIPSPLVLKQGMKGVWEGKTTFVLSSMHKEKWHNAIPQNYYCQVLHYLNITGYDFIILTAQLTFEDVNRVKTHEIRHYGFMAKDKVEDLKYLEDETTKFWNDFVLTGVEPPLKLEF